MNKKKLSLIVTFYNEEESVEVEGSKRDNSGEEAKVDEGEDTT